MFIKGEAVTGFPFRLVNKYTGDPITTGTVMGYVLIDGGTQTALTGTAVSEGNGQWSINLTATEMDGDLIGLLFTHADSSGVQYTIQTTEGPGTSLVVGTPGEAEICNLALVEGLGDQPITSLDDDSNRERSCKRAYPVCRDELLVDLTPGFAIKRVALALLATAPTFDFTYRFQLPTDCLQVLETDDPTETWRREGATVVSYNNTCSIKYVARITDTSTFSPPFTRALVAYLQARLAYPITKSSAVAEQSWKLYEMEKDNASAIEGQEGARRSIAPTTLTDVRL
jgi:hypothetical protein